MSPNIDKPGLALIFSVIALGVVALLIIDNNTRTRSQKIGDKVTGIIDDASEEIDDFRYELEEKFEDAGEKKK